MVQISALVILLLFIWAFYVIINNIKATDEALEAKDEVKALTVEVMEEDTEYRLHEHSEMEGIDAFSIAL